MLFSRRETMSSELHTHMITDSFFERPDGTLVTWLGMAGVLLNVRGTILLIDPLISLVEVDGQLRSEAGYTLRVPLPIQARQIPRADLVMVTHADEDQTGA
jgi:L-ascorbate metabolism protein UlaG (beta-lactamase superfamily)